MCESDKREVNMIIFKIIGSIVVLMGLIVLVVEFLSIFNTRVDNWKDCCRWYAAISVLLGYTTIIGVFLIGLGILALCVWGIWV